MQALSTKKTSDRHIVVTTGDPAGVGPDLCLDILNGNCPATLTIIGDSNVLAARAKLLQVPFDVSDYAADSTAQRMVLHSPATDVIPGQLSSANAAHVLSQLHIAVDGCQQGHFDAVVTGPVSKETICTAGYNFCGQTEYIAELSGAPHPVMLLASSSMRVALATRHLPLSQVAAAINEETLVNTLRVLNDGMQRHFINRAPCIAVTGLNPHAGEGGYLGDEETRIIIPAIERAVQAGVNAKGPFSADTVFFRDDCDCVLAMYHDQGLPVIKYAHFDNTVNVTLGLPFFARFTRPRHGGGISRQQQGTSR
jgi:4-hydroxythreonine-4-phosphate dehydrogenase